MSTPPGIPAFRPVPFTGVIFVMAEAGQRGYRYGHPDWCNLGQGQPETGPLPGAPPRMRRIEIGVDDQDYAPVPGIWELRRAVAELYNGLYRQGKRSQYTERNVCICGGGRASLTRAVAALGQVNLGHFLPDYTAYEELLDIFKLFTSIPILLDASGGYRFGLDDLEREIMGRGLSALLLSNPCNPTGKVLAGAELEGWVRLARELSCALLIDEFYSHYVWRETPEAGGMVSAARYVDDVDTDPVVLFDGLTKNWRYPGWRCTWIVGPQPVIEAVSSSGSFLDGGGSKPVQRAAVPLLAPGGSRRGDRSDPGGVPAQAADHAGGTARGGRAVRPGARGDLLLLGGHLRRCRPRSTTGCRSSAPRWSARSSASRASSST